MSAAKKTVRRPAAQQRPSTSPTDPEIEREDEDDAELDETEADNGSENDEDEPETAEPTQLPAEAATEPEYIPGAPKDGRTFKSGDPVYFKGKQQGNSVVALETIYRASLIPNTDRWKFNLVFTAGTVLPQNRAKKRDDEYFDAVV